MSNPSDDQFAKKLGLTETPVQTTVNMDNGNNGNGDKDYLKLLELTLLTPVLSLIKIYLIQTNGTKKTTENCMLEFRTQHSRLFFIAFFTDLIFRMLYLAVVIIVAIRGLGIDQYFKTLFS